jgi:hypothetical protein
MNSIAAYYVYIATTAAQKAAEEAALRGPRPSLVDRLRALAAALSTRSEAPRPA